MYNNFRQNGSGHQSSQPAMKPNLAESLPDDYVEVAEKAIVALQTSERFHITTSKLRSLFAMFSELYNQVSLSDQQILNRDQINTLKTARVRIYYEIGRDDHYSMGNLDSCTVGRFVKQTKLIEYLSDIGSSTEKLIQFYHYMEALVAFHRFYFGEIKDKR